MRQAKFLSYFLGYSTDIMTAENNQACPNCLIHPKTGNGMHQLFLPLIHDC